MLVKITKSGTRMSGFDHQPYNLVIVRTEKALNYTLPQFPSLLNDAKNRPFSYGHCLN